MARRDHASFSLSPLRSPLSLVLPGGIRLPVYDYASFPKIIYSIDEFAEKYGMMGGLVQEPVMAILIVPKAELLIGQWQSL